MMISTVKKEKINRIKSYKMFILIAIYHKYQSMVIAQSFSLLKK